MPNYSDSKKDKVQNVEEMESGKSDDEASRPVQEKRTSVEACKLKPEKSSAVCASQKNIQCRSYKQVIY